MEPVMAEGYLTPEDSPIVRVSADEARDKFAETVSRVAAGEQRVIVSQDGKDVAAIISIEEFWFLERVIEKLEDEMDVEEAKKILAETNPEDYIPYEQIKKELGLE